jgi:hypothetical protein
MILAKNNGVEGWRIGVKDMYFPDSVSVSHDVMVYDQSYKYNVLCVMESEAVLQNFNINDMNKFDLVITWRESILEHCPKAFKLMYGTAWAQNFEDLSQKEDKVSFLISSLNYTEGHKFRNMLMSIVKDSGVAGSYQLDCFVTPPTIESKNEVLNRYKFSIIVENDIRKNYFTEKIIDCFVTKTIPIYWGCPNINEYFDESSIIQFDTLDEFLKILDRLDDNLYNSMINGIENNFQLSKQYLSYWDRIEETINNNLWGNND